MENKKEAKRFKVRVSGYGKQYLIFENTNKSRCGLISGYSVKFDGDSGGFVICGEDLKNAINKIEESSENKNEHS